MKTQVANIATIEDAGLYNLLYLYLLDQLRQEIRTELESFINNSKTYHFSHAQIPEVQKTSSKIFQSRSASTVKFSSNSPNPDRVSKQLFTSNQKTNSNNNSNLQQKFKEPQYILQQEINKPFERINNSNFVSQSQMKNIPNENAIIKTINSPTQLYQSQNQTMQKVLQNNSSLIKGQTNPLHSSEVMQTSPNQTQINKTQMIVSPTRSHNHSPEKHKLSKCKIKIENLKEEIHDNKKTFEKKIENEVAKVSSKMFNEKKVLEDSLYKAEQKLKEFQKQETKLSQVSEQAVLLQKEKIQIEKSKKKFKNLEEENIELELKVQEQDRIIQILQKQVKDEKATKKGGYNDVLSKKEKDLTKKNNELTVLVSNLQLENKTAKEQNAEFLNKVTKMKKKNKKLKFSKQNLQEELELLKRKNILYENKIGHQNKTVSVQYEELKS